MYEEREESIQRLRTDVAGLGRENAKVMGMWCCDQYGDEAGRDGEAMPESKTIFCVCAMVPGDLRRERGRCGKEEERGRERSRRPEEAVGVVWVVRPNSLPKPPAARYRAQPRICGRAVLLFRNQRASEGNDGKEGAEAALSDWTPEETQAGGI